MLPFGLSKPVLDIDVVSRYQAFSRTPPLLLAVLRMLPPSICVVRYLLSTVRTWQTLGLIVAMSFVLFQSPSSACYPRMTYPTTLLLGTILHTTTLGEHLGQHLHRQGFLRSHWEMTMTQPSAHPCYIDTERSFSQKYGHFWYSCSFSKVSTIIIH